MEETWNICNKSKLLAQRNKKHIQTGVYLLSICPECFRLPIAVGKHEYTYKTAFLPIIFVSVLKFLTVTQEHRPMVFKNRAMGEYIWI